MKHDTHERLLQFIHGELTQEERVRMQEALDDSAELRAELTELRALQGLLQTTVHTTSEQALQPFFADRLMRRISQTAERRPRLSPEEEFFGVLLRLFRPVAVAGVLLILVFATYNVTLAHEYNAEPSATEAVFALPPVSLATAYDAGF